MPDPMQTARQDHIYSYLYYIYSFHHQTCKVLVAKQTLLVRMKNYKVGFINVKNNFVGCQSLITVL